MNAREPLASIERSCFVYRLGREVKGTWRMWADRPSTFTYWDGRRSVTVVHGQFIGYVDR